MKSLIRLVCIVAGAWIISYGVDGLSINTAPKYFTIEEVERNGVGDARYVVVTGAQSTGAHMEVQSYRTTDPDNKHTVGAAIPLYSGGTIASFRGAGPPPTSLLYKLEGMDGCLRNNTCGLAGTVEVRGVVRRLALWGVGTTDSLNEFSKGSNFIYVKEGVPMPRPIYLFIALAGCIIGALGFLPDRQFDKYVTGRRR
jgi:hypothetical protein